MSSPKRTARPRIGAHVSVAGGLEHVVTRAKRIGADAVQIFAGNPRQWKPPAYSREAWHVFAEALAAADLPVFLHTIYLINLASPDEALRRRSIQALEEALVAGARAGARGVVTHLGSHRGAGFEAVCGKVAAGLRTAWEGAARRETADDLPPLLLENSAGGSGSLGASPAELQSLVDQAGMDARLGVCLDTAHAFAAGYPVHTEKGLDSLVRELEARFGLVRLGLIHLNDSSTPLGARRDRHENLWEGCIGREGLSRWVRHPALREIPFVLETPGFGGEGPDRRNVGRAKRLRRSERN